VRYLRIRKLPHVPAQRAVLQGLILEKVSLIYSDSIFHHEPAEFISKTLFFVMFLLILDVVDDAFFCLQSVREGSIVLSPAAEGREMRILEVCGAYPSYSPGSKTPGKPSTPRHHPTP
jgi:hypothetical protein